MEGSRYGPPIERHPDGTLYQMSPSQQKQASKLIKKHCCQLRQGQLYPAGRWGRVRLSAADFLFRLLPLVSECGVTGVPGIRGGHFQGRYPAAVRELRRKVRPRLKPEPVLPRLCSRAAAAERPGTQAENEAHCPHLRAEKARNFNKNLRHNRRSWIVYPGGRFLRF